MRHRAIGQNAQQNVLFIVQYAQRLHGRTDFFVQYAQENKQKFVRIDN